MARKPRASVPKTSGQGISRLAYQKGRALGNKGEQAAARSGKAPSLGETRSYAKEGKGEFNVQYGGMFDIKDVEEMGEKKPKTWDMKRVASKKLKGG
jgi:hypothetical protein